MKPIFDPMEQLAVIVWGLATVLMLFAFAMWQAALWGAIASIAAAGLTYLFQVFEVARDRKDILPAVQLYLFIGVLLMSAISLALSAFGV